VLKLPVPLPDEALFFETLMLLFESLQHIPLSLPVSVLILHVIVELLISTAVVLGTRLLPVTTVTLSPHPSSGSVVFVQSVKYSEKEKKPSNSVNFLI
jgi:hypothetical protein